MLIDFLGDGQWKRVVDVAAALECPRRAAYRWVTAAEAARVIEWRRGKPGQGAQGGGRIRLLRRSRRAEVV
jgi:hypothetical protein